MKPIRSFFLAGIIQGSKPGKILHNQDYRDKIKSILKKYFPDAEIIDPVSVHPNSADYDHQTGEKVFFESIRHATRCDCMIAYLPEASMGTAIEMWECYRKKVRIWTISPMKENWSVRFLSDKIFKSLDEFEEHLNAFCD